MDKRRKEKDRRNCKNKQADKKHKHTNRQTDRIEIQRSIGRIERQKGKQSKRLIVKYIG